MSRRLTQEYRHVTAIDTCAYLRARGADEVLVLEGLNHLWLREGTARC
jgi:hypothetical protein